MQDVRAKYNALLAKEPPKGAPCKNMKTFLLCCALVVFLVIIMIVVSVETNKQLLAQTETCQAIYGNDPDAGPVGCRVCQEGARSNDISHLPFYNLGAQSVSHNLGSYHLLDVNGTKITPTITFDGLIKGFIAVRGGATEDDPANYVQALGLYFVFAILMCIITTIVAFSVCGCKFCCNCSCCGRSYPTEKSSFLGFEHMKDSDTFQYSSLGVWSTRIFMGTFAFFLALWLGLGQVNGNLGMTDSMKALTHAPDGLVSVIRGVTTPVAQLLENLISHTFVGLFQDLNETMTTRVNLGVIIDGVECILNLLGGFPTSATLRIFVEDLQGALHNLTEILSTRVPPALANLTGELDVVRYQVTDLRDYINGAFAEQLIFLISNLTVLQNYTDEFNEFTSQMLNPACCATKANNDLIQLQDSSNNISNLQYQDMIIQLSQLIAVGPPVSNTTGFIIDMNTTQSVMASLPNFNNSANELDQHNMITQTAIDEHTASNLVTGIIETDEFLKSIDGFSDSLNHTVEALAGNVSGISLDPIRAIILDFNRSSYDLPDFSIVINFIGLVNSTKEQLFPCMLDVAAQLKLFDMNVAELPQQFLQIDTIINSVNDTLQPALDTIVTVRQREVDLQDGRNKFNISKQLDSITDTEDKLRNYTDAVTSNDYLQSVRDAENKAHLNISILPDVQKVNESLPSWILPAQNISDIRSIETSHGGLNQDLPLVNLHLPFLLFGYCADNFSRPCTVNTNCSVTCLPPMSRCQGTNTPCASDSTCVTPVRCLGDKARLNRTRTYLVAMQLAVYAPGSMSGISALLEDARNSSQIDTSPLESGIVEANNSLHSVQTGSLTTDLNNVIISLNDFNVSDFSKEIDDINNTLNDIDFSSIVDNLDSLDSNFQSVEDERRNLDDARQFLDTTKTLFYTRLPLVIENFSVSVLRAKRQREGVAATLQYLAETIDRETAWLDNAAGAVLQNNQSEGSFATNFTKSLASYKDLIYTLCDSDYSTYGSTYFLLQLMNSFSASSPLGQVFIPDGSEDKVDKNKAGNEYPNKELCVTTTCLDNSIDWVNSAPLSEVSGGKVPVSLSRTEVIGIPYLIPLAILICATASTLLFCRSPRIGWYSSCLATCTCYGAFCCMPIIFIIVGMTFPLVIVSGDMCYSVENVGYNLLQQQGSAMCNAFSGSGPITNCVIPWTLRNQTHNTTIDILGTYAAIVAPGCNPNAGAIYNGFEQAKDAFSTMPSIIIANFVNNNTNSSNGLPINFRWPIKQIFVDAAADLSVHARTFGTGLQQALSCSQLYTIYSSFKGAVCCDVVSAFYWALGSWYLIAWTLLCCGCCAGLLGRKRFAQELWGAEYMQLKDKAYIDRDVNEQPAAVAVAQRDSVSLGEQKHDAVLVTPVIVATATEPEFVAPPTYQPLYETPAPAYADVESKGDMEMVAAPTSGPVKTVDDF